MAELNFHPKDIEDANGYSEPFDVSSYSEVFITTRVPVMDGTSPTLDVYVEHSFDAVHWTRLVNDFHQGMCKRISNTGSNTIRISKFARYIRAAWELGGTEPVITFEIAGMAR